MGISGVIGVTECDTQIRNTTNDIGKRHILFLLDSLDSLVRDKSVVIGQKRFSLPLFGTSRLKGAQRCRRRHCESVRQGAA